VCLISYLLYSIQHNLISILAPDAAVCVTQRASRIAARAKAAATASDPVDAVDRLCLPRDLMAQACSAGKLFDFV
jgi:hypothetical protein